jgi:multiple sugar transport system substrate-binding protein
VKKLMAAFAVSAAVVSGLSGCASATPSTSDGPVALTFWHGYTEADGDVLNSIVEDFNASQDGVVVTPQTKTWAVIDDTLLTALSSGEGPQLVAMPAERLPVYASKKALVNLDDFYADDTNNASELNAEAVAMETVNGSKFGVPTGFVPLSVFYDKDKLATAGVTTFPTTWADWVAAAKASTIDADGDGVPEQYGLALPDHGTVGNGVWASLFEGGGGSITNDDGTKATVDSPANVDTLTYWADAVKKDAISPTGLDGIDADKLFTSGKAVMHIGGPWMASLAADAGINYGIAAIPAGPAAQAASAIGVSMAVTAQANAAEQAAAEKFLAYFNQKDVAIQWSLGSGWPALRTDVTSDDVSSNATVAALTEFSDTSRALLPGVVKSTDVLTAVDEATQKALAGGDPATLLAAAQASVQQSLDK